MPLHLKTVTPALKEILYELMDCSLFKPFRLVGGTNLCLRFGYRLSSDIDLFTDAEYESIDFNKIENFLQSKFPFYDCNDKQKIVGMGRGPETTTSAPQAAYSSKYSGLWAISI